MPWRKVCFVDVLTCVVLFGSTGILIFCLGPIRDALVGARSLQETQIEGVSFPKTLVDPAGISQKLVRPPQRIVSTVLMGDEMLAALVPSERLRAVTFLADDAGISNCAGAFPASVTRLYPDLEAVLALEPDLVLATGYNRAETVNLMVAAGIPILRFTRYDSFQELMDNLLLLGAATGTEARASEVVEDMRARIARVTQRVQNLPHLRVLYYSSGGDTTGPGTVMHEMMEIAGGSNVVQEAGLRGPTRLPLEMALGLQPEVIVLSAWNLGRASDPVAELMADPVWQEVPAVRNRRVYAINGAWLTCVSQHAVRGLEELAALLHPEKTVP